MRKIAELAGQELKWVQPSALKMIFELRTAPAGAADTQLAGVLRFRSAFGTYATAESGDGCWTFKRVGFFQTHVAIRACQSEAEVGEFRNNTWSGGGTLTLPDRQEYYATTNFWQTRFQFQTEPGDPLVRFKTGGLLHLSSQVEILPAARFLPDMPLMVLLGWYLIIMMQADAGSTTAATAGAMYS